MIRPRNSFRSPPWPCCWCRNRLRGPAGDSDAQPAAVVETCKTVGKRVICDGVRTESYGPADTESPAAAARAPSTFSTRAPTTGTRSGRDGVAYLGSLLFAADDLVLCLFCGPSRAAVIQASDRLGIPSERLMDSARLSPGLPLHEEAPPRSPPSRCRAWPSGPANCD
jgi:hypothetical protein